MMNVRRLSLRLFLLVSLLVLAACQAEPEVVIQEVPVEVTRVVTDTVVQEGETIEVTRVVTETVVEQVEVTVAAEGGEEMMELGDPPSEPQQGGDVRIWLPNGWPEQSWPHRSNWESGWAISPMAETLFWPLADGLEPRLATGYEVSEDGLTYTVSLREGVTWHDGEPFTAEDVVYSIHLRNSPNLRPLNGVRQGTTIIDMLAYHDGEADSITGIEIVDDLTIQFNLESPDASFARLFLAAELLEILPEHIVSGLDEEAVLNGTADYWFTNPIGTGPWKFVRYEPDQFIEYERNDDYWGGAPAPDRLFMEISTAEVAIVKLQRGELHMVNPIVATEVARLQEDPTLEVLIAENSAQWYGMEMNYYTNDGLWQNPLAKQAFLYSIDRQGYVDSILQGQGTVRHSFFDGTIYACPTMVEYNYDPDRAAELWAEIGINPADVTIDMMSWLGLNARRDYLPIAQEFLRAQGFKVNVDFIDNSLITDYVQGNGPRGQDWDFHVLLFGPGADPGVILPFITPDSTTNWGYRSWPEAPNPETGLKDNAVYFQHPDLPALIDAARTETDPDARVEIYQQIDCIWNEYHPAFATASPSFLAARSQYLQGTDWQTNAGLGFWLRLYHPEDLWVWDGS
ncbi:MAG: ABC transporter substrate-binding protein [Anaerolineales bacterium]|nr:ABC transporter substrate-binding protein [Anaerolineales bacterium]MCB0017783.1 ABC transporter substrate-binding protein [Anaerolineales bacterium]MCB8960898.1 ABC transporter substrate-binding protein [Ardenticatenales bacterium]